MKIARDCLALRQRGASLLIALIALVALSLGAMALIRSVDTGNVIAGNLAFRQSALQTTDVGIEKAFADLNTIVTTSLEANWPASCTGGACKYYTLRQAVDSRGIPTTINWTLVESQTVNGSYKVQYVIDRLCGNPDDPPTLPITDISLHCYATEQTGGASKKIGSEIFTSSQQVYFRATVRVQGPRNTLSMAQAIFQH